MPGGVLGWAVHRRRRLDPPLNPRHFTLEILLQGVQLRLGKILTKLAGYVGLGFPPPTALV